MLYYSTSRRRDGIRDVPENTKKEEWSKDFDRYQATVREKNHRL